MLNIQLNGQRNCQEEFLTPNRPRMKLSTHSVNDYGQRDLKRNRGIVQCLEGEDIVSNFPSSAQNSPRCSFNNTSSINPSLFGGRRSKRSRLRSRFSTRGNRMRRSKQTKIRKLLNHTQDAKSLLKAKVNYFFKPYSKTDGLCYAPPMNFTRENPKFNENSEKMRTQSQNNKLSWHKLGNKILSTENQNLIELKESIENSESLEQEIGVQYYLNNFLKISQDQNKQNSQHSQSFSGVKRIDGGNDYESFDLVKDGVEMIKNLFVSEIQNKQNKICNTSNNFKYQSSVIPKIDSMSYSKSYYRSKSLHTNKRKGRHSTAENGYRLNDKFCKPVNSKNLFNSLISDWNQVSENAKNTKNSKLYKINVKCAQNVSTNSGFSGLSESIKNDPLLRNIHKFKVMKDKNLYKLQNEDKEDNSEQFQIRQKKDKEFGKLDRLLKMKLDKKTYRLKSIDNGRSKNRKKKVCERVFMTEVKQKKACRKISEDITHNSSNLSVSDDS